MRAVKLYNFLGISNRIEFFQYFDVFWSSSHKNHSNAIKQSPVRSNRTRKNIELFKNFEFYELMFNSVRFGSVSEESSKVFDNYCYYNSNY